MSRSVEGGTGETGKEPPSSNDQGVVPLVDERVDERSLILRAREGDEEAFLELVDLYRERIWRIAYRIVRDSEEADDVVQDAFARASLHLRRFDFRAGFYTWLVSITRNAAFDALRSARRRGRLRLGDEGFEQRPATREDDDPVRNAERAETARKVHEALGRLKERDRMLLVLREFEGMKYEEIAKVMGCAVGTVESGIHRARKKLKKLLGGERP